MAKTAKVKKREPTAHSRAARRATSPSINLPKSLKNPTRTRDSASPRPHPASIKPHVLAAKPTGITKRAQKSKPLKRAQRLRQQKGMERAEDTMDKFQVKVAKSVGREKKVKERSKGWEEINGEKKRKKKGNAFEALVGEEEKEERGKEREWVSDEEMDEVAPEVAGEGKALEAVVPESVPLPVVGEDELL